VDDDYGLREAADRGDPKSMFAYAIYLKNKNMLSGGVHGAEHWFRKACEHEYPGACEELKLVKTLGRRAFKAPKARRPVRDDTTSTIPKYSIVRLTYKQKLDRINILGNKVKPLGGVDFQVPSHISHSDACSYASSYGVRHSNELRDALKSLGLQKRSHPFQSHLVDVLDIGCGPSMTLDILKEFGIRIDNFSGYDHAESMLWLARELNSDAKVKFAANLDDFDVSRRQGLVIMNHVINQKFVNENILKNWVNQLRRIFPKGFSYISVEPSKSEFNKNLENFENICRVSGLKIFHHRQKSSRSSSKSGIGKRVNYWECQW
jgi:SAM-dependent methyltransferase